MALTSKAHPGSPSSGELEKAPLLRVDGVSDPGSTRRWLVHRQRSSTQNELHKKIIMAISLIACFVIWQWSSIVKALPFSDTACETLAAGEIPQYVLDYAPLIWLDINETYYPSDMYAQIANTSPDVNFTTITDYPTPLNLTNLNALDAYGNNATNVYLTSLVDITTAPAWLNGVAPDSTGKTNNATSAAIIVNDHGNGQVDAFYMYFYAYNQGNKFLGVELGDHIGDWEHNMVRFSNGIPQAVWYSQHSNGEAFTYSCLEKVGMRPVGYSARGTHATYAINGTHDHTIPDLNLVNGLLEDYTSQGMLWDPLLSAYYYTWDADTSTFTSSTTMGNDNNPLGAMTFYGRWGDEQYPDSDPRQLNYLDLNIEWRYVSGPTGPWDKHLNRTLVCPSNNPPCIVHSSLVP